MPRSAHDDVFLQTLATHARRVVAADCGLDRSPFYLEYQAVTNALGRVGGAEALLRYCPEGNVIPPNTFIPLLQRMRLFDGMARPIIDQAVADARRIFHCQPTMTVSVNISSDQLKIESLVAHFSDRIVRSSLNPDHFGIEISEADDIGLNTLPFKQIQRFMEAGHPILIDDFGVGFSNMSRLVELKSAVIKLDKTFLDNLSRHTERAMIAIRHSIDLAHALGAKVTVEGVETATQFALMADAGADYFQGFYISRPKALSLIIDELTPAMRERRMLSLRRTRDRRASA
jgi:EAL domain-containing protein (putative c-di-GMP-specific phosphodiesterase class I)